MGSFDDIVSGAKSAAETVGRTAGKLVDITKLRLSAADINNEISKRFESLGRVYYNARKNGNDIEILAAECEVSIDALYERLHKIEQKIAELNNKSACECGTYIAPDVKFCPKCGRENKNA